MNSRPQVSPYVAGLTCKCPQCGQGALFASYLGLRERCEACGLDYGKADPGDGPAVFAIFIVGFLAVALAFVVRFLFDARAWVAFLAAALGTGLLVFFLLRPLKATLIALQFRNKAEEARHPQ